MPADHIIRDCHRITKRRHEEGEQMKRAYAARR